MAIERFLAALVFCEGPLDAAYCGTSVTTGANPAVVMKLAPEDNMAADTGKKCLSGRPAQRQAGYELAFDGLNCFETVVLH